MKWTTYWKVSHFPCFVLCFKNAQRTLKVHILKNLKNKSNNSTRFKVDQESPKNCCIRRESGIPRNVYFWILISHKVSVSHLVRSSKTYVFKWSSSNNSQIHRYEKQTYCKAGTRNFNGKQQYSDCFKRFTFSHDSRKVIFMWF